MQNFQLRKVTKWVLMLLFWVMSLACRNQARWHCNEINRQSVSFLFNSISVPAKFVIVDTVQFGSKSLLYNKVLKSTDGLSFVWISVNDYGIYPDVKLDFNYLRRQMKNKVKSLNQNKDLLITENVRKVNNTKVSFLKSCVKENNTTKYLGHIFFISPKYIQIEIVIQLNGTGDDTEEALNCIFSSLKIN
jgi:hypothetical protein